ncbi:MAG: Uma2 family endonuclease [Dehalococcoidia bacterium]
MVRQATARAMTDAAFEQLALDDPDGKWELWQGTPRRKPAMTFQHNAVADLLARQLWLQIDIRQFHVRVDKGHVHRRDQGYFVPDVFVIPAAAFAPFLGDEARLEAYTEPMPLVVEVLSPSTRRYNQRAKLAAYQQRGDREIWLIDPRAGHRRLTAWRRQPDGAYAETVYERGEVRPVALPGVVIDFDALFTA